MLDHLQTDAVSLRFCGRALPSVTLVHVRQLHQLAGRFLHSLGQLSYPSSLLFVGRSDKQASRCPKVSTAACTFEAFLLFAPS